MTDKMTRRVNILWHIFQKIAKKLKNKLGKVQQEMSKLKFNKDPIFCESSFSIYFKVAF